jgi:septation ring formation regulator EzrA
MKTLIVGIIVIGVIAWVANLYLKNKMRDWS